MIKVLDNLVDQLPAILLAIVAVFFLWGLGYLIVSDMATSRELKQQCIAAGMQYISGSCVK